MRDIILSSGLEYDPKKVAEDRARIEFTKDMLLKLPEQPVRGTRDAFVAMLKQYDVRAEQDIVGWSLNELAREGKAEIVGTVNPDPILYWARETVYQIG